EAAPLTARRDLPDADGLVVAAGDEEPAGAGEGEGGHKFLMAGELHHLLAGGDTQKADALVLAAGGHELAGGGGAGGNARPAGDPADLLACAQFKEPQGEVGVADGDERAVRGKGQRLRTGAKPT